ncbi:type II secretion system F family protein, partial [Paraburkholderia bryophila]|uniref:type II secretion system F family protein n=1 Tax=Paraburkholderia bryophila TaxID=420952 RepID=UPI001594718F
RGYNTVRFASTLAILTAAGVPILRALQAAGETLSNRAMSGNIDDAIVRVREGTSLLRALNHVKTFPPVLVQLIRSGEATGDVTTMLDRAADGEARELARRTMFITSVMVRAGSPPMPTIAAAPWRSARMPNRWMSSTGLCVSCPPNSAAASSVR